MKRRIIGGVLALCCLMLFCAGCTKQDPETPAATAEASLKRYSAQSLTLFNTVSTFTGYAADEETFNTTANKLKDTLLHYHQLFDVYNGYDGIANIKTINDQAGIAPVKVDGEIIRLLKLCERIYDLTGGQVNVAMGSVLVLWHDFRDAVTNGTGAALPDPDVLREAMNHTDFKQIVIDEAASTVYLPDPKMRLDVGAVAKGYAVQRLCEIAPEGFLLNIGGNVAATGNKPDTLQPWSVGIQDPDQPGAYKDVITLTNGAIVTSGDYERYVMFDGKRYHHIIDPETLYPSTRWRSVTVLCEDSALGDGLSTALFIMDREAGEALIRSVGADAMWIDPQGGIYSTAGYANRVKK